jgi:hypothetical protein
MIYLSNLLQSSRAIIVFSIFHHFVMFLASKQKSYNRKKVKKAPQEEYVITVSFRDFFTVQYALTYMLNTFNTFIFVLTDCKQRSS